MLIFQKQEEGSIYYKRWKETETENILGHLSVLSQLAKIP